ncbi:MAG TPA: ATP-binding cassette domain-containing protein, partial [bacterium]|nr:ATP-binding cassette domain-containing protein [bacterium]
MTKPLTLQIENLAKHYSLPQADLAVLTGVNLIVQPGEFISIVGTSGCGKSTLLRLIGGLEQVSEGRILFGETPIQNP